MLIPLSPQALAPFLVGRAPPPRFVGRSSEIELIHTLLQGDERAAGIVGPSGIGKTALALTYAYRFRDAYPGGVFWVDATLGPADELASLARAVGLSTEGPAADRRRRLVLAFADFLSARPNALLILDDVEPALLDTRLLGFVPIELPCRVLFTTTTSADRVPLAVLGLDVLPEDAVASLFAARDADEPSLRAAQRLAALLGGHPLAAAAASAWLGHGEGRSLADLAGDLAADHGSFVAPTSTPAEAVIQLGCRDVSGEERRLLELVALFGRGALMSAARLALFAGLGELGEKRVAAAIEALFARGLVDAHAHGSAARIAAPVRAAVEARVNDGAGVRAGVLLALERAYDDLGRLDREVARRGARAVLADLRAAEVHAQGGGRLGAIRATLELEVGALDGWDPAREPSFFLQQLRERADDLGLDALASRSTLFRQGSLTLPPREGDFYVFGLPPGSDVNADDWRTNVVDIAPLAFAELRFGPLLVTPGLRVDAFLVETSRKTPRIGKTPGIGASRLLPSVDPRFSLSYSPLDRLALSASLGLYHQAPSPEDLGAVFGTPDLGLSRATHASLGTSFRLPAGLDVEVTGFYVYQDALVVRSATPTPALARALAQDGEGRVFGAQVFLRRQLKNGFYGWIAYTASRSERRAGGATYRLFDQDQSHVLNATAGYEWHGLGLGARLRYATGSPRTPVVGSFFESKTGQFQPIFGAQNGIRLPNFFSLDLRLQKSFDLQRAKLIAYLDVTNATNQDNPEEIVYNYDFSRRGYISGLPTLAILGGRIEL